MDALGRSATALQLAAALRTSVGVQLTAGPWEEATLIRLSAQLEQAPPLADRRPALSGVA